MNATAKDLRFNSKELLDAVKRGEEVVISFRGKACAKLVPYQDTKKQSEKSGLFGMWQDNDATRDVEAYVRDLRKGRL